MAMAPLPRREVAAAAADASTGVATLHDADDGETARDFGLETSLFNSD
jgi:hypothetical protein